MRLVANFKKARVDDSIKIDDQLAFMVSRHVRDHDGILWSSSAINLAGAYTVALSAKKGSNILTFMCDLGERSYSKLYDDDFLLSRGINLEADLV